MQDYRETAIAIHGSQKYGEHPYVYHLDNVFDIAVGYHSIITEITNRPYVELADNLTAIVYFHDMIEDVSEQAFDRAMGVSPKVNAPLVKRAVRLLTKTEGREEWELRMRGACDDTSGLASTKLAAYVKWCDRLANVEEGEKNDKYREEHESFKAAFSPDVLEWLKPLVDEVERTLGIETDAT